MRALSTSSSTRGQAPATSHKSSWGRGFLSPHAPLLPAAHTPLHSLPSRACVPMPCITLGRSVGPAAAFCRCPCGAAAHAQSAAASAHPPRTGLLPPPPLRPARDGAPATRGRRVSGPVSAEAGGSAEGAQPQKTPAMSSLDPECVFLFFFLNPTVPSLSPPSAHAFTYALPLSPTLHVPT